MKIRMQGSGYARELLSILGGRTGVMNILRKIVFSVAVVLAGAIVVLVLRGKFHTHVPVQPNPQTGQQFVQINPQIGQQINPQVVQLVMKKKPHHAAWSSENKAPVAAVNISRQPVKPVVQAQQKSTERVPVIRQIQTADLLTKPVASEPVKINSQQSALPKVGKASGAEAVDGFGLDVGNGLPLPTINNALVAPQDRPAGFHVGVNYHLDQNWELTGLAGVTTTEGIVANPANLTNPVKPSVNQVGIQAGYRF